MAILSHASRGWVCLQSHVLIDGYAILAHLSHRRSTESLWLMCVYGNHSGAPEDNKDKTLGSFYSKLVKVR